MTNEPTPFNTLLNDTIIILNFKGADSVLNSADERTLCSVEFTNSILKVEELDLEIVEDSEFSRINELDIGKKWYSEFSRINELNPEK